SRLLHCVHWRCSPRFCCCGSTRRGRLHARHRTTLIRIMTAFGTFFLPGPTEVRPEILDAMRGPMMPHRGADFETLFGEIVALLQPIFRTARPVYVSTSSA